MEKAASDPGISVEDLRNLREKDQLLAQGLELIQVRYLPSGQREEFFKGRAKKGDFGAGRAVVHGVLDVATLGLWELAATPIEGAIANEAKWIAVRALYPDYYSNKIEKLDITP
ncbi:hypothetical protein [Holospora curviuscula]|uniref:hypothetical protein n=1 Tax=Holospora curviuscula TaxID=1082868 RepID=UPI001A9C571B|nr:hypothetical protein [Holospora curviuscula]